MSFETRACILAVGTEITTGQIVNGNASTLSERLTALGLEVVLHETVPDDRGLIREALDRCSALGAFLFVTGGLGPTTDDFTRDEIAGWLGREPFFHEASWKHIETRLARFGVPTVPSQRQQCYYPQGAEVFENAVGTANGFRCDSKRPGQWLWILPGPPRELTYLWDNGIGASVRERVPEHELQKLFTWKVIGRTEAELGEQVEAIVARAPRELGLKTGYRLTRPYIEVKLWCPEARIAEARRTLDELGEALGPYLLSRDGRDLAEHLLEGLAIHSESELYDSATGGLLLERLGRALRDRKFETQARGLTASCEWVSPESPTEWIQGILAQADPEPLVLAIAGFSPEGEFALGLRHGERTRHQAFRSPYKGQSNPEALERIRRHAIEIALKTWTDWLRESVH